MDIFDEIIECLLSEAENNGALFVRRNDLNEFFSDVTPAVKKQVNFSEENSASVISAESVKIESLPASCGKCPLAGRERFPGNGAENARVMFIGDFPCCDDTAGIPFSGESGKLLNKMIMAMNLSREQVYVMNVIECSVPPERPPDEREAAACAPQVFEKISKINPEAIVLFGPLPLKVLAGQTGFMKKRGKWIDLNGIPAMPTFHPTFLRLNTLAKRDAWNDLKAVIAHLGL